MKVTVFFGGINRERLVSVASAKSIAAALPEADLWFWHENGRIYEANRQALLGHERPFEVDFQGFGADLGALEAALDKAVDETRLFVLAMHGGMAENGALQKLMETRRIAYTGSGSDASQLAFDKIAAKACVQLVGVMSAQGITLEQAEAALGQYGRLIAKPAEDGSSYGIIFINSLADIEKVREASRHETYLIEPFVTGPEATCGVLEQADGSLIALPPVEIVPSEGAFDYAAKYLKADTQEICPARFAPEINAKIQDLALKAHKALGCRGYSRTDFIISDHGPIFLETNTLPGLTASSLYPKALKAQGVAFIEFLTLQIDIAKALALEETRT
jgi:D-alanine-D-alanine ligase